MKFTAEHEALRHRTSVCRKRTQPFIPEWEAKGRFPDS